MFSAAVNAAVLFISTDYVFDGTSPPYSEEDDTNPLNDYGLSKLEAEKIVLSVSNSELFIMLSNRDRFFLIHLPLCFFFTTVWHTCNGGASAAKEPGHFEVRTSSNLVTQTHFFPQKSWPFLVVALKTRRPPTPLRLFHCQNKTNKVVSGQMW